MKKRTRAELRNMTMKDIAKAIRQELKLLFPNCKFSVTKELYAGGASINIALMKSDIRVIRYMDEIPIVALDWLVKSGRYTYEQIERMQDETHHQLNTYTLLEKWDKNKWCNGVFLTKEGHNMLQTVVRVAEQYNWNNSDPMTDYFDVNFYLHVDLGKWDKPFIDGGELK